MDHTLLSNLNICLKRIEAHDSNLWSYVGLLEQLEKMRVKPKPIKYEGIGYSIGASAVVFALIFYVPFGFDLMGFTDLFYPLVHNITAWIPCSLAISFIFGLWWGHRKKVK